MDEKISLSQRTTTDETERDVKRRTVEKITTITDKSQEEGIPMQSPRIPINSSKDNDDYDPHMHRIVEKPTSNFETLIHLLKSLLGTGILAMPQAIGRGGLCTAMISIIIIAIIVTHSLHLLVRSQYALCKLEHVAMLTYPDSMRIAINIGPEFLKPISNLLSSSVNLFLVTCQLGICCVYTVFIAETLKKIVDPYHVMEFQIWMFIILGPLLILNLIRDLKMLAPFSILGNILILLGLGIIIHFLLTAEKKSNAPYDLWGSIRAFPLLFGTILFSITSVAVVTALENNMKTPEGFGKPLGVLNIGMAIVAVIYMGFGAIGYTFCKNICSDSISLDLKQDWASLIVQLMYAIAILISYVLQSYVPTEILWKTYIKPRLLDRGSTNLLRWEYCLRIFLCLFTFVVALLVPRLGLFISLIGALCLTVLGLIFPAILDICVITAKGLGLNKMTIIKDIFIIITGFFGMIVGTYTSIEAIIVSFK